ncbi:hypothetical protein PCANC_27079 [Puccinia coronata f. sp. avenae]|uniref:Uncharacterized protein n=1 Tax=Puccinia coronata f. sp. avenae TaxID=200324 RepID=A0A2N5S7V9_9BASI|nr:hypothetical protein PCANC_27079 [Puccinia coronata f. sp. avenae]
MSDAVSDKPTGWGFFSGAVDHQLGSGLSSRPSSGSHLQRKSLSAAAAHYHHKNKNSLLIMKSTMAGLMSHLSGNLAYQLATLYCSPVRVSVLKAWMESRTYLWLYRELPGALAESISTMNRRLRVLLLTEAPGGTVEPKKGRATDALHPQ